MKKHFESLLTLPDNLYFFENISRFYNNELIKLKV